MGTYRAPTVSCLNICFHKTLGEITVDLLGPFWGRFDFRFESRFEVEFSKTCSTLIAFSNLFSNGTTAFADFEIPPHWSDMRRVAQFFFAQLICFIIVGAGEYIPPYWQSHLTLAETRTGKFHEKYIENSMCCISKFHIFPYVLHGKLLVLYMEIPCALFENGWEVGQEFGGTHTERQCNMRKNSMLRAPAHRDFPLSFYWPYIDYALNFKAKKHGN